MEQDNLFFDGPEDAIQHLIRVLGGLQVVGHALRPDKGPIEAGKWLANTLNEDRREVLTFAQVLFIMRMGRERGCHVVMEEICKDLSYAPPVPVSPADEAAELDRRITDHLKDLTKAINRLEDLRSRGPVMAVRA